MASWIVPVGLAAAETYALYTVVEPAQLKPSERTPAYFADVEWWCPISATVAYLGFCYFGSLAMRKRGKPLDEAFMKRCMMVYNFYQTVFNVLCIVLVLRAHREQGMKVWGNRADWGVGGFGVARFIWMHYNNKYIELLDSVFMVLRCKFEQLSFLHVYHHTLLIWSWFVVMKIEPVGDAYFGSIMNTGVHVIMYSYYFLSACGVQCFWKKYITQVQMLQFVIVASHSFYTMYEGNVNVWLPPLQLFVMVNMFVLFANFYRKSYSKKKLASKSK